MILTDYPGHLVVIALVAGLAVVTFGAFHAPEVRTPARARCRWFLMLVQYAVILLLLLITWNPSALKTSEVFTTNTVLALFDTSESMSIADEGRWTRLDRALEQFAAGFEPDDAAGPRYRLHGFDRYAYHCGSPDLLRRWGTETNLHAAFSLLADHIRPDGPDGSADTPAGAIIFTDGQAADKNVLSYPRLSRKDVPVLLVGVGSARPHMDIAVESISAPARVWIDTAYPVTVTLAGTHLSDEALTLELLRDREVIESRQIGPEQLREQTSEFTVPADALGAHVLTARVKPLRDEANTANNIRSASVEVTQEQMLHVLLYSQQASFDIGKLRQALAWDRRVRCDFRLDAIRDPVLAQRASSSLGFTGFPETRDELYAYDVVVLGPCDTERLTAAQQDALHGFVADRGGGLLLLPGQAALSGPAEALSPVLLDGGEPRLWPPDPNTIEPTFEAQALGLLNRTFSPQPDQTISAYYNIATVKPAAVTVATVSDVPIISVHRVGRGRVCLLNVSKLFKLYREDEEGGVLAGCIVELAMYLGRTPSRGSGIELFVERTAGDPRRALFSAYIVDEGFKPADEANVLLTVGGQVVAMQPAGEGRYTADVDLGSSESVVATVQAEAHGAFLGERIVATNLPSLRDEMSDTDFDEAFLRAMAQRVGARYVHVDDIGRDIAKTFVARRQVGTTQQVSSLWPNWPLLLILCLLLSLKWFIRRSTGLV